MIDHYVAFPSLRHCRGVTDCAGRLAAESLGGGTGVRVGKDGRVRRHREGNDERVNDLNGQGNDQGGGTGVRVGKDGRVRRHREGNDERVNDLNGQGNDQGMRANRGVQGVNRNVEGADREVPDLKKVLWT
nr:hypothetical protein [Tanacetum cinerariifolium]